MNPIVGYEGNQIRGLQQLKSLKGLIKESCGNPILKKQIGV
jgi:hypothetical protein